MFEQENIDSQRLAVIGIFTAILIFVLVIGIQVLFWRFDKASVALKNSNKPRDLQAVQTEQATALNTYKWVDRDTDTVTIPIQRAMQLQVETLAGVRQ